jgi:serine protease
MKRFISLIIIFLTGFSGMAQTSPPDLTDSLWHPNTLIFKVHPDFRHLCHHDGINHPALAEAMNYLQTESLTRMFPRHSPPTDAFNELGQQYADITLLYKLVYKAGIPSHKAASLLLESDILEYAEARSMSYPLYTPNDPLKNQQYYLSRIMAYQAWDITKGDTNVVIGISDTGTDLFHPDLVNSIKYNYFDTIDGIDNDNDGYIDNFRGWDLGENDNYPQINAIGHGSHVSGIASATADNGIGIAGTGFKCKFLPVKVDDAQGRFVMDYESIVYAADQGCHVINCSWGSRLFPGRFAQEIINYATINKNALVVAACGNSNNDIPFWPASLKYVLSVGGTDSLDVKWAGSSFGHFVDVCAPANFIHSTWVGSNYITSAGTSMAAPMVSAGAALVKSRFPQLNALQLAEQLRVSADVVDTLALNLSYTGMLGAGRINLFKAVDTLTSPSIRLDANNIRTISQLGSPYDTLEIEMKFINYLAPTQALSIQLESPSIYVQVVNPVMSIGAINTLDTFSTSFQVVMFPNTPFNHKVMFKLNYSDTNYTAFEYFSHQFKPAWITVDINDIRMSIPSDSRFGFNDYLRTEGEGFRYRNHRNMLYIGGLMLGVSNSRVMDNVYGDTGYDTDFSFSVPIAPLVPAPQNADTSFFLSVSDANAGPLALNVTVEKRILAWSDDPYRSFVIFDYLIKNTGSTPLNGLYAALFADWDIRYSWKNRTEFSAPEKLAYAYSTNGNYYSGLQLLSSHTPTFYAFDSDGSSGSLNIYDGFTSFEKYIALTTTRSQAGFGNAAGADIAQLLGCGPFTLNPGDTLPLAWAIVAGDNLISIKQNANEAWKKYYNLADRPEKAARTTAYSLYPNPAKEVVYLSGPAAPIHIRILNIHGQVVLETSDAAPSTGINIKHLPQGLYLLHIQTPTQNQLLRFVRE